MRRATPALIATVLALGLLANFHTATGQTVATDSSEASAPPPTVGSRPPAGAPPTTVAGARRTVDGADEPNRYGDVQVRLTLQGNQIVDVQTLVLPNDRERSAEISDFAGPRLRLAVLKAQSAHIDLISGATYTSASYRQSVQSALDSAGVH
jgi:uncharacterized protein with FMN-binding domain